MITEQQMTDISTQSISVIRLLNVHAVNNALTDLSVKTLSLKNMTSAQLAEAKTQLLTELKMIQQQK